jgi:tetratricopeptide (TPR) repeat protein
MSTLILGCALALAAAPELQVSRGAEVVAFPPGRGGEIEIGVYHNQRDLASQVAEWRADWLSRAWVRAAGGGVWFVVVLPKEPGVSLGASMDTDRALVRVKPAAPAAPVPDPPDLALLLSGTLFRRPAPLPDLPLRPIPGDGRRIGIDAEHWTMPLAKRGHASWVSIDEARVALASERDVVERAVLQHTIGLDHLALGLPREASYYLDAAALQVGGVEVHLARAEAAFAAGQVDRARDACRALARVGAEAEARECVAVLSLASADPPPTEAARALLAVEPRPAARVLAAMLLLSDNRAEEAITALQSVDFSSLNRSMLGPAYLLLGDALLEAGRSNDAARSWAKGLEASGGDPVIRFRLAMAAMYSLQVQRWGSRIPDLQAVAASTSPAAPEARHALVQLARVFDDPAERAVELGLFYDRWPDLAERSGLVDDLVAACSDRLALVSDGDHPAELVDAYRRCWRPALTEHVGDTSALERVADAAMSLGLEDVARDLVERVTQAQARNVDEHAATYLMLARLYLAAGRGPLALETLAYAAKLADAPTVALEAALLRSDALVAGGDVAGAEAELRRIAARHPEARARLGRLYYAAGRDAAALTELRAAWSASALPTADREDAGVLLAHVLDRTGRSAEAEQVVAALLSSEDKTVRDDAAFLLGAIVARDPARFDLSGGSPAAIAGPWLEIVEEERTARRLP